MKKKLFFLLLVFSLQTSSSIFFVDGTPTISDEFEEDLRMSPMPVEAACNSIVTFTKAGTPYGELWSIVESTFWCYHETHNYDDLQKITTQKAHILTSQQQEMLQDIFKRQKDAKKRRDERDAQPGWDPINAFLMWWNK